MLDGESKSSKRSRIVVKLLVVLNEYWWFINENFGKITRFRITPDNLVLVLLEEM